jgi:alpha-D-xyloside xylohydrolase
MAATLHAAGVETLVSMYPYQNKGSIRYAEFVPTLSARDATGATDAYNGCLQGQTLYDAFNPAARAAVWDAWTVGYGRFNLSWMWQDCSEPGRDAALNGRWLFAAGSDAEVGPAWTREHARAVSEGQAAMGRTPSDFVTLSRAWYPGSAALGTALWSGDVETTFESLQQQVAVAQQAAMSGVSVWASDTGGYQGGNATDPLWCELVTRWSQFSAFTPLFRFHGRRLGGEPDDACGPTHGVNEPWEYCADAYASIAPLLRLRETLRPYVLATSAQAAATGLPMVRPLALSFPSDAESVAPAAEASFMFGDAYLVAPVTAAGVRETRVWLPRVGANRTWVDFFDASRSWVAGGVTVDGFAPYPAPDGRFPLFELRDVN